MAVNQTMETEASVEEFLNSVANGKNVQTVIQSSEYDEKNYRQKT